ncbi:hypothetical protein O1611_g9711 [Lasiodiplodia mahajangana]|uniref:Uncharacterized protein n=1 Tax=Lasiodiplodia mahajangana TaxID=1108764 RepID=A0ACC2J6I2_9PEZI|nr:hypothetical protein O1611_g9711 [Lasiodiplodia mahajangana]
MLFPKIVLLSLVLLWHGADPRHLAQRDSVIDSVINRALDDPNGQPSCRPVCESCGSSCSVTAASKRNLLELVPPNTTAGDELSSAQQFEDTDYSSFERALKPQRQTTIGSRDNPQTNLISLDLSTDHNDYTFAVRKEFSDFSSNVLNIGIEGLTGCTVLAVVSPKAVYMAHFYENLAFRPDGRIAPDTAFEQNCLNLITGQGARWRARGDHLDPSLFEGTTNGPAIAYIMTPRQDQETPTKQNPSPPVPGPDTQFYPGRMEQLSQTLTSLIPGLEVVHYNYIAMNSKDYTQSYQGRALFEYDPNADGSNNANFRLWYEQTMVDGRSAGIIKLNPGTAVGGQASLVNGTTKYGYGWAANNRAIDDKV